MKPRRRRTFGQRLLLAVGTLSVLACLAGAGAVAWTAEKFQSIERTPVKLDRPTERGEPANYLIVGSDSRSGGNPNNTAGDAEVERAPLADVMMLVRVDPNEETVELLSFPRDLWVTLPNGTQGRLNAAYAHGPQDLINTLRTEFDLPIHHYIEVDFQGFLGVVDAVDGVPIWLDAPVRDFQSGLKIIDRGCLTLDGEQALAFARARHLQYYEDGRWVYDGTGDLGRISRQQIFIRRVMDRATDKGFSNPLTMKRLIEVGVENLKLDTGLAIGSLFGVGERFSDYGSDELETYTIPSKPWTTDLGAQVLDIDRTAAEPILARFREPSRTPDLSTSTTATTAVETSAPTSTVPYEVTVLNSSSVAGRAEAVAGELEAAGFVIARFGNGSELDRATEPVTIVRHAPDRAAEANAVAAALEPGAIVEPSEDLEGAPVVVFLGAEDAPAVTTTTVAPTTTTAVPTTTTSTTTPGYLTGAPPPGKSCG